MNRRDALRALASGSAVGAVAGGMVIMTAPFAAPAVHDPMLDLVARYNEANRILNASQDKTDDEVDAYCEQIYAPLRLELMDSSSTTTTQAGAIEALRLAARMSQEGDNEMAEAIIGSVIDFLEGRA